MAEFEEYKDAGAKGINRPIRTLDKDVPNGVAGLDENGDLIAPLGSGSTPTLQQILTAGGTYTGDDSFYLDTTNEIFIRGVQELFLNGGEVRLVSDGFFRLDSNTTVLIWNNNLTLRSNGFGGGVIADTLTADRTWLLPDADGTVALISDLSAISFSLSDVLGNGTTTGANNISVDNGQKITLQSGDAQPAMELLTSGANGLLRIQFGGALGNIEIDPSTITFLTPSNFQGALSYATLTAARTWDLPDASGTIALTSDLSAYLPLAGSTMTGDATYAEGANINLFENPSGGATPSKISWGALASIFFDQDELSSLQINAPQSSITVFDSQSNAEIQYSNQKIRLTPDSTIPANWYELIYPTVVGGIQINFPSSAGTIALTSDITGTNSGTNTGDETTGTIQTKRPLKTVKGVSLEGAGDVAINENKTHTGDVTGAEALTIASNVVSNAKLSTVATKTVKGRDTAGTGNVEDLSMATLRTMLGVKETKAGKVLNVSFAGNPRKATITFATAFADAEYSPVCIADSVNSTGFVLTVENITATGFTINTNTNNINDLTDVRWTAIKH